MKTCPICRRTYSEEKQFCPDDGSPLVAQSGAADPRGTLPSPLQSDRPAHEQTVVGPPPLPPKSSDSGPASTDRQDTLLYSSVGAMEQGQAPGGQDRVQAPDLDKLFPPRKTPDDSSPIIPRTDKAMAAAQMGVSSSEDEAATRLTSVEDVGDDSDEVGSAYLGKLVDDRYLVKTLIGRGGMGAVYRVEQVHLRKEMAIKLLHENLVSRKQLVSRFTREARAISRLSSAHTVMVYDFGRWGEVFYLVMELLEGEALDALLNREGPLHADRTTAIILQMCDSLAEAHRHGIVHRDLKPENVMLLSNGPHPDFVKILDFGLAKVKDVDDPYTIHSQKDIFGTPHYMSPEQIRAAEVDNRSDIYAVGALIFRMLTGEQVFGQERNTFDILKAHLMEAPPRMKDVAPDADIPEALEHIVAKAIEKKPEKRFDSMEAMAEALVAARKSDFTDAGFKVSLPSGGRGQHLEVDEDDLAVIAALDKVSKEAVRLVEDDEALGAHARRGRIRGGLAFAGVCLAFLVAAGAVIWGVSGPSIGQEAEPNDTPSQANLLDSDGQTQGAIGQRRSKFAGDRDCFRLPDIPDGADLGVEVQGVPNMDLAVSLHNEDGTALMSLSHRGPGDGEKLRHLATGGAPAVVCVSEQAVPGQVAGESLSDIYRLGVTVRQRQGVIEQEPNDGDARDALPQANGLRGTLDGPLDRDLFTLNDNFEHRIIRVHISSANEYALEGVRVALLDLSDRPLTTRLLAARQPSGELAFGVSPRQIPGRLVIHLTEAARRAWKRNGARSVPYKLWYALEDLGDQGVPEPNNTPETARDMVLGAWHVGDATDAAGVDWLRIDAGDANMKRIKLEANAPKGSAYRLTVRDRSSNVDLRQVEVRESRDNKVVRVDGSGAGFLVRVERIKTRRGHEPPPSSYQLRARWTFPDATR